MADLEDTVRRLADRAEIADLIASYFRALDGRDQDGALEIYAEEACLAHDGERVAEGRGEIGAFVAASWRQRSQIRVTHYLVGVPTIRLDGDAATTETYAVTHQVRGASGADATVVARGLRYLDTWRRTSDGWRVVDRLHVKDFEMSAPALYATTFEERITRALFEQEG